MSSPGMQLLREPLFHFAIAGAMLFGTYSWLDGTSAEPTEFQPVRCRRRRCAVAEADMVEPMVPREPSAEELKGLVDDLINEKLLAREAEATGLGENDTIIRRRLAQKLKFLVEDTAQLAEPSEAELRQFYAAYASHFETPGRLSFRQIYFNPEHHTDMQADATAVLAGLRIDGAGGPPEGDRLLFGDSFVDADELALSGMFGEEFARAAFALEPGAWRGPVKSGYGVQSRSS